MAKFVAGISSSFLQVVKSIDKQSNISSNLLIQQYYKNLGNMKRKEFELRTESPTKKETHSFEWVFIYSRIIFFSTVPSS